MGNYAAVADVADRLRKNYATLYTPRGLTDEDETIVAADIEAAEADLHSYLAARYVVPVTDAEAVKLLKHWTLILVEEIAYGAVPGVTPPETVTTRVKELRERLQRISEGKLSLGTATELDEAAAVVDDIIAEAATPVFTRTTMEGF